ncbi:Chlorophyllide a oxygenase [Hibiscus syriacus]|uniref:Chlorophyllide a oxygenase n=1 Tax=Hibiscus syriacus TaxID=106335 RepID=A0A6A2YYT9_HIBSY|nr:Chlorophyllide a oxygenase [Hibiscus syriacus]
MLLHEKVVEVLNPLAWEYKSIGSMKKELAELQGELAQAHKQVHTSEARVSAALDKLAYLEKLVNGKLLEDKTKTESSVASPSSSTSTQSLDTLKRKSPRKSLDVSGPIPIDCFEEPWVLFRGKDGNPGCVQNTCVQRACPLHLGSVNEGRIQCPCHG